MLLSITKYLLLPYWQKTIIFITLSFLFIKLGFICKSSILVECMNINSSEDTEIPKYEDVTSETSNTQNNDNNSETDLIATQVENNSSLNSNSDHENTEALSDQAPHVGYSLTDSETENETRNTTRRIWRPDENIVEIIRPDGTRTFIDLSSAEDTSTTNNVNTDSEHEVYEFKQNEDMNRINSTKTRLAEDIHALYRQNPDANSEELKDALGNLLNNRIDHAVHIAREAGAETHAEGLVNPHITTSEASVESEISQPIESSNTQTETNKISSFVLDTDEELR